MPTPRLPKRRLPLPQIKVSPKLVALGAGGVLMLAAFLAIQVFGDPSAAGPRGVVSLAPTSASAATAPRITFSEAAAEGSQLSPSEINGAAQVGEITADGQLHVSVVDAPEVDASGAPTVHPLPRAPIAGLTQQGPNGVLPIVAANGMTVAQAYARPFAAQSNHPLLAVIIGGLGFNAAATTQAINELPPEITLSFVPYAANLQSWIDQARAHGHEVMLELPMEPFDSSADDTGPQTLLASATPQQNVSHLEQLLSLGAGYFGVTNYQGARFATSAQASQPIVQALKRRGLVFVSSGIGQRTALTIEASRAGLTNTAADRIIDARREADAIDDQLLNLEALALQNQSAIGAGFAYPVTMQQVGHWASDVGSRGYQLAPVSAVLAARATHR